MIYLNSQIKFMLIFKKAFMLIKRCFFSVSYTWACCQYFNHSPPPCSLSQSRSLPASSSPNRPGSFLPWVLALALPSARSLLPCPHMAPLLPSFRSSGNHVPLKVTWFPSSPELAEKSVTLDLFMQLGVYHLSLL